MNARVARLARGGIVGAFATAVAATGHGLADGSAPSVLALSLGVVFATVLGTLGIGRRPSLPRLAAVVAASQGAFHVVFSSLTPGTAVAGHHGSATILATAGAHHATNGWMWAAHAAALLATIAFLRRAERALWNLLRAAVETLVPRLRSVAIAARPRSLRALPAGAPRHPVLLLLLPVLSRRGPPSFA